MQCGLILILWGLLCAQVLLAQPQPVPTEMQKAMEEFRVRTRDLGMRADSPRRNGAAGANGGGCHGRVYENFRNDFLDAVPHQITQNGGTKSLLRRNQFGFSVSGPLRIPKLYNGRGRTFFSVTYEGVRDRTARGFLNTIATEAERGGDFSGTVDQSGVFLPIFDPKTTRRIQTSTLPVPCQTENLQYFRDPFPGNRIQQDRLDRVAQALLGYYPTPNTSIGPFLRNNYFLVTPEANDANGAIIRVDHNAAERHRFHDGSQFVQRSGGARPVASVGRESGLAAAAVPFAIGICGARVHEFGENREYVPLRGGYGAFRHGRAGRARLCRQGGTPGSERPGVS